MYLTQCGKCKRLLCIGTGIDDLDFTLYHAGDNATTNWELHMKKCYPHLERTGENKHYTNGENCFQIYKYAKQRLARKCSI